MEEGRDFEHLRDWIGRRETREDVISAAPAAAMAATLDHDAAPLPGEELPPLWHWLYFVAPARQSAIGTDGHPARAGLLPPVPLPRRRLASSRLEFHRPLLVGTPVRRDSTIVSVQHEKGPGGDLVVVVVRHEINDLAGRVVDEEQHHVYRGAAPATPAGLQAADRVATWRRVVHPDPVLLFRYSALTFNGHRIHYDRPYAVETEGYPGLVLQIPLVATLLVDELRASHPGARVSEFAFRALRPLFEGAPVTIAGQPSDSANVWSVWASDVNGNIAMEADAVLAP
jgi:3-methylfumaryl-CoA hydratase